MTWKEAVSLENDYANLTLHIDGKPPMRAHLDRVRGVIKLFIGDKSVTRKVWNAQLTHQALYVESLSLNILYLSPSLRRDFLDEMIATKHPAYTKVRRDYAHILTQRNKLLGAIKDGKSSRDELTFWDEKIVQLATTYYAYRKDICDFISHHAPLSGLLPNTPEIRFEYISKLDISSDIATQMQSYFQNNRDKEIILCRTLRGPHLDDWTIAVGDEDSHESTHFLSRGENKMLFLTLVESIASWIAQESTLPILYLFDDVFAELDEQNSRRILSSAGSSFCMTSQTLQNQSDC